MHSLKVLLLYKEREVLVNQNKKIVNNHLLRSYKIQQNYMDNNMHKHRYIILDLAKNK